MSRREWETDFSYSTQAKNCWTQILVELNPVISLIPPTPGCLTSPEDFNESIYSASHIFGLLFVLGEF